MFAYLAALGVALTALLGFCGGDNSTPSHRGDYKSVSYNIQSRFWLVSYHDTGTDSDRRDPTTEKVAKDCASLEKWNPGEVWWDRSKGGCGIH